MKIIKVRCKDAGRPSVEEFEKFCKSIKFPKQPTKQSRFDNKDGLGYIWEFPGIYFVLKRYTGFYDPKDEGEIKAGWGKQGPRGYQQDKIGQSGGKFFNDLNSAKKQLFDYVKQYEERLGWPPGKEPKPKKPGVSEEQLDAWVQEFDKIFGRNSKYFNDYGGHYASYAQGARSAWDYLGGDIVIVLKNKGGIELETAFGDFTRFKAGDFEHAKRKLEKWLKEYGDDE